MKKSAGKSERTGTSESSCNTQTNKNKHLFKKSLLGRVLLSLILGFGIISAPVFILMWVEEEMFFSEGHICPHEFLQNLGLALFGNFF